MDFVGLKDILDYLERDENSRGITEGEKILNAKHIITCGFIRQPLPRKKSVYAVCIRSSQLQGKPYVIEGTLIKRMSKSGSYGISKFLCNCPAGAGGVCKHIAAVLLFCNRNAISTLEEISSTDKSCYWSRQKSTLKSYETMPLQDFCCVKKKTDHGVGISEEIIHSYQSRILEACPNSALARHKASFLTSPKPIVNVIGKENVEEFSVMERIFSSTVCGIAITNYNLDESIMRFFRAEVCVTKEEALDLALQKQNSDVWFRERQKRITGSTCYSFFTYSKNKSPDWKKKVASLVHNPFTGNAATRHGQVLEDRARSVFQAKIGTEVFTLGLIVHPDAPWFGYSPDGLYVKNGNLILLEIKCPFKMKDETALAVIGSLPYIYVDPKTGRYALKARHAYYGQVQLGMYLTGAVKTSFILFSSFDNSYIVIEVLPDRSDVFFKTLTNVYFKHVLPVIVNA